MPTLTITKQYADDTLFTEAQLDAFKTSIETFFNFSAGGTGIDDDNIQAGGISTSKLSTATQQALCPTGCIMDYPSGVAAPSGWLLCDGSLISTTTYADLFVVLSTVYGSGSGTFGVPDLRGRVTVGRDNMDNPVGTGGGAASRLTGMTFDAGDEDTLGSNGGADVHTLIDAELSSHSHTDAAHTHGLANVTSVATGAHNHTEGTLGAAIWEPGGVGWEMKTGRSMASWTGNRRDTTSIGAAASGATTSGVYVYGTTANASASLTDIGDTDGTAITTNDTGSDTAHNNMPPMMIMNKIIKT